MEDAHLKFRFIYARFLVILFSFLTIYSFLHWLFVIKLGIIDINENVVIWGPPLLLPIIPLWIWLRKRIRLLNLQSQKENLFANYLLVAHLAVAATTVAFQYYLISAAGELRALKTPEEITLHKPVKYYTIGQFYADKSHARLMRFSHISGKHNKTLHYEIVIAVPLRARDTDTLSNTEPPVWVCLRYETSLSNSSTSSYKDAAWESFYEECVRDLDNTNLNSSTYLDRPGNGKKRDQFVQTVGGEHYNGTQSPQVLEPRFDPFAEKSYGYLGWTVLLFIGGAGIWWFMILYKYFDEDALQKFLDQRDSQLNDATFRGYI